MAEMAVYDKRTAGSDLKKYQYFRHDYIYYKNVWTRFFTFIGCVILAGLYILKLAVIDEVNILAMAADGSYEKVLRDVVIFTVIVQVAYTVIGTVIHSLEYQKARGRVDEYFVLADSLDALKRPPKKIGVPPPSEKVDNQFTRNYNNNLVRTKDAAGSLDE